LSIQFKVFLLLKGGGLMCGLIEGLLRHNWLNQLQLIAVETKGADCFHQATIKNEPVLLDDITSIAKTLGAKQCASQLFNYYQENKNNIKSIVVSDTEAVDGCLRFLNDHRMLVEPSCGCSLSVAYNLSKHFSDFKFKNVVVIVCGGSAISLDGILKFKNDFNL
jgi:L-serine/L-threonine ammonia-lyase